MADSSTAYATLDDWIAREAIAFDLDVPDAFNPAVDLVIAALGASVELLGLGEAMHGAEEILVLRNRMFERLVAAHGYTAIAVESSFPRAHVVNEYVNARGPASSYDDVRELGFSHGFGRLEANRELIEWMRRYNADPSHAPKLRFYGFDAPTEMTHTDSPRQLLHFALDYHASIDHAGADARRRRIDELLGDDAAWANPAAMMEPSKSIGLSPAAAALRIETEDLIADLLLRRPELATRGTDDDDDGRFAEAVQHAKVARQLLTYHAGLARASENRIAELLGVRDVIIGDNLAYMLSRERDRAGGASEAGQAGSAGGAGKVLAFGHNSHLKRGQARWQLGPHALAWWPAGAHLAAMLGPRYAVIGSGVGMSDANGIGQPAPGTLEARLTAAPGPARFIPTHLGRRFSSAATADLPTRAGGRNPTYFPLTRDSFTDFDALAVLDAVTYTRGGPPLQGA
jgi:erythromycin esterase-like protein